jgi:hypothetical protein
MISPLNFVDGYEKSLDGKCTVIIEIRIASAPHANTSQRYMEKSNQYLKAGFVPDRPLGRLPNRILVQGPYCVRRV